MTINAPGSGESPGRHRVVVVGSTNADLLARVAVHPVPGETLIGNSMTVLPGGKGANQAVAAARLGADTSFVGAVGSDDFAEPALAGLRAAGVDLSGLTTCDGPTGIALVTVSADGENSIIVIPGANGRMDADAVKPHRELIAEAAVVVVQGEIPRSGVEQAAAESAGRLVVNLAPVIDIAPEVIRAANPLVVNEHEAALVLAALDRDAGQTDNPLLTLVDAVAEDRVVAELLRHGVCSVVLTVGARGALVADESGAVRVPSPRMEAVDTTGAGDAFVGALAYRLADGDNLVDAVRFAARVGAFAVGGVGAQPSYPSGEDSLPVAIEGES